ncbi:MAG: DUF1318 domain-containing protein [Puniceicoccaceae bacterium]
MRPFSTLLLLVLCPLLLPPEAAAANRQAMREAREAILERLPETENLWNRGLTGESNEGFVVARSALSSTQISLIQEENRDRAILYTYVAEKTGTDLFSVGRERAILIGRMAGNGLWIQNEKGRWVRK